jgi:hypothetical protein
VPPVVAIAVPYQFYIIVWRKITCKLLKKKILGLSVLHRPPYQQPSSPALDMLPYGCVSWLPATSTTTAANKVYAAYGQACLKPTQAEGTIYIVVTNNMMHICQNGASAE